MLEQVRVVLVNPSHPGNIGGSARAMKNMSLSSLYLVSPRQFPHPEATARAAGADDILSRAVQTPRLIDAVQDCHLVFGTSARDRRLSWPSCTPRECAQRVLAATGQTIALVFGCESRGLSNEELAICHYHVSIPAAASFTSLNLAAAVQILVYEIFTATIDKPAALSKLVDSLATVEQVEGVFQQLAFLLEGVGILDPKHPRLLLRRLRRIFNRAGLEEKEVHILRGLFSALKKRLLLC